MSWLVTLLTKISQSEWFRATFEKKYLVQEDPLPAISPTKPMEPQNQALQKTSNPQAMLNTFCTAIKDYEGGPANLNYKNNNPGNCRCSPVGYLPKYGAVKCVNNFAVFESYNLGWEYLENLVMYRAELHPDWTIGDFFRNYAPTGDANDPSKYAAFVANRCGVSTVTTLRSLFG